MTLFKLVGAVLMVLIGANALNATAASVATPNTNLSFEVQVVDVNNMKPASCAGVTVTNVVGGSGVITGTSQADLITGSAGDDTLNDLGGTDCLVAGDGVDDLRGGQASDVCDSGAGVDTFFKCETQIQ